MVVSGRETTSSLMSTSRGRSSPTTTGPSRSAWTWTCPRSQGRTGGGTGVCSSWTASRTS
ncbi:hypothetical protein CRUP_027418 [Coryphaenoides rupestris]|nr:hypothetical protein CRUP_027418 [Coryphaenoides rupestris]